MSNRLISNVLIVDSASLNNTLVSTLSNSASQITKFHVNAVMFFGNDTTGRLEVTSTDTSGVILKLGGAFVSSTQFGTKQQLEDLKVVTLTAGTAYFYLV